MSNKTIDPAISTVGTGGTDWDTLRTMTPEQAEIAAVADPDAPPLSEGQSMRRMVVSKRLRMAQGLSIAAFAAKYHIPVTLLTMWERREAEPDAVATAYLAAIAADPVGVAAAVDALPGRPNAAE